MLPLTRLLAGASTCVPLLAGIAAGQRVRGVVVQPDGATPALGVVVVATRPNGGVEGRALSAPNGAFEIPLPKAGAYTVSALRIGYRPTVLAAVAVPDTGATTVRGGALVAALRPGLVSLRARSTGHAPGEVGIMLRAGRNSAPLILGDETPPRLDSVRVAGGRRISTRLDGFAVRRAERVVTLSLTADEISSRSPVPLSDLLRGASGIRVVDSAGVRMAVLERSVGRDRAAAVAPCVMPVVLDGVVQSASVGIEVVRPGSVLGFEVFGASSRIPVSLGVKWEGAACGVIVIHTGRDH